MAKQKNNKKKSADSFVGVFFHLTGTVMIILFFLIVLIMLLPKLLGYEMFYVVSPSMEPTIHVDSMIYVKEADPNTLEEGTIIAYSTNGSVVTHRITENDSENRLVHTKGDMNQIEDLRAIEYDEIIGKVVFHVPYLGILGVYLGTLIGKLILIIFGVTGIILTCI